MNYLLGIYVGAYITNYISYNNYCCEEMEFILSIHFSSDYTVLFISFSKLHIYLAMYIRNCSYELNVLYVLNVRMYVQGRLLM